MGRRKKQQGIIYNIKRKIRFYFFISSLLLSVYVVNWVYQAYRKPAEVFGVFDKHFNKNPRSTWESYKESFREKATSIMTPELLASLAQMETNGNPVARTYWKWSWTTDISRVYAPASTATGMFQITHGTFEEAKNFCVKDGQVYQSKRDGSGVCWNNFIYSRLIPSHAIELTSARLHFLVTKIIGESRINRVSLRDQQALAVIIHLCGAGKGAQFARKNFRAQNIGRCGDHSPVGYLHQVRNYQERFRTLNSSS